MSEFSNLLWLLIMILLLQLAGLVFAVLSDSYIKRAHRIIMMIIAASVFLLIVQNIVEYFLVTFYFNPLLRTINSIVGYSLRPMILLLFFYIVDESKDYNWSWALVTLNAAIHLTAFFSGLVFRITPENSYERGPLGYCCHIVSAILLFQILFISLHQYGGIHKWDVVIPLFNATLIVGAVVADSFIDMDNYPVSYLTSAVVLCCVFYYIWLHLQFVREYEQSMQAEQRIQLMISQIQPHFLFNTLSTIQALCLIDPDKASDTVGKFGVYLRQNLESLNQPGLIPFDKELEHVRLYADIEMIRFPFIKVEYFIEDRAFSLPALSVQPLVENAIRHGVRVRDEGLVTVRTWKDLNAHIISITDNGCGFDVKAAEQSDKSHIGIRNVRERLEKMCGGTLTIKSMIGEGTSVLISIPSEKGIV